jgi:hypothetical protein
MSAIVAGAIHDDAGMRIDLLPKVTEATLGVIIQELAVGGAQRAGNGTRRSRGKGALGSERCTGGREQKIAARIAWIVRSHG